MNCAKCGLLHERCSAHVKGSDPPKPCMRPPKTGSPTCRAHGGGAPRILAKVERERALAAATALVTESGYVDGDPLNELLRMVRVAAIAERALAMLIERDLAGGILETVYTEGGSYQKPHPYIDLWNSERDRLTKTVKVAIDANLSERQVRIQEAEAAEIVTVILDTIDALPLTEPQKKDARLVAARVIQAKLGGTKVIDAPR